MKVFDILKMFTILSYIIYSSSERLSNPKEFFFQKSRVGVQKIEFNYVYSKIIVIYMIHIVPVHPDNMV